jgi:hypothetical protein
MVAGLRSQSTAPITADTQSPKVTIVTAFVPFLREFPSYLCTLAYIGRFRS